MEYLPTVLEYPYQVPRYLVSRSYCTGRLVSIRGVASELRLSGMSVWHVCLSNAIPDAINRPILSDRNKRTNERMPARMTGDARQPPRHAAREVRLSRMKSKEYNHQKMIILILYRTGTVELPVPQEKEQREKANIDLSYCRD
jgi:hypothetical protein